MQDFADTLYITHVFIILFYPQNPHYIRIDFLVLLTTFPYLLPQVSNEDNPAFEEIVAGLKHVRDAGNQSRTCIVFISVTQHLSFYTYFYIKDIIKIWN